MMNVYQLPNYPLLIFQILLNHPNLNINHKSDGGITPLMAAVKQYSHFMVTQLTKKTADITATDNKGRLLSNYSLPPLSQFGLSS